MGYCRRREWHPEMLGHAGPNCFLRSDNSCLLEGLMGDGVNCISVVCNNTAGPSNTLNTAERTLSTAAPREFVRTKPTVENLPNSGYVADHRFRGYPKGYFLESNKPLVGKPPEPPSIFHGRKQHFVQGQPPEEMEAAGKPKGGVKGVIGYGSDDFDNYLVSASSRRKTFWNEDRTSADMRKKAQQLEDSKMDYQHFKEVQQKNRENTVQEKKKDLKMLVDYKPWGRPGGGAPVDEQTRRTKNIELNESGKMGDTEGIMRFGQPGHGAPLRTNSGKQITNLKISDDIRFRGDHREVENHLRYQTTKESGEKYSQELASLTQQRREAEERQRRQDLEDEKKTLQYDPYGRPGAGAPLKTNSGNLKVGRQKTLASDSYELREVDLKINNRERKRRESMGLPEDEDSKAGDPWGKGYGAPRHDENGNLISRFKWSNPITVQEYRDPSVTWATLETKPAGGGGLVLDERGEKKTKLAQTLVVDRSTGGMANGAYRVSGTLAQEPFNVRDDSDVFNPWGKPGAGAPVTDSRGNVVAANRGKVLMDKMGREPCNSADQRAKHEYLNSLKNCMKDQQEVRSREEAELKKPGGEVASWIRSKEVGYPKRDPSTGVILPDHHKTTSDVTQQQMDIRRPMLMPGTNDLRSSLEKQAAERQETKQIQKQVSRINSVRHHETFGTFWNRPGAGAPNQNNRRHSLDMEKEARVGHRQQPPWSQPQPDRNLDRPLARTKNMEKRFEPQPEYVAAKPSYHISAPWADS